MRNWTAKGWVLVLVWLVGMTAVSFADEVHLIPSLSVREEYNDNVFFSHDDTREDFLTTITAGVEFLNRTERRSLHLIGAIEPFFYGEMDQLDDANADTLLEIGYLPTPRMKADLEGFFKINNQPDRDLPVTGLVFGSDERYQYHGGFSMQYALHENHDISLSYEYDQDDWRTDDDLDRQDFEGHTVGLRYSYDIGRWLKATQLLFDAGYGFYDYETSELDSGYVVVGGQRMLNELFRMNASIGARYTESEFIARSPAGVPPEFTEQPDVTEKNNAWGGILSAGIEYIGERTRWDFAGFHDLRTTGSTRGASTLTRLILKGSYRLLEKLAIGGFVGYYINRADTDEFSDRELDVWTFNVRPFMRWRFDNSFSIEGAYHYTYIEDEEINRTAERNVVYLKVMYAFDLMD